MKVYLIYQTLANRDTESFVSQVYADQDKAKEMLRFLSKSERLPHLKYFIQEWSVTE